MIVAGHSQSILGMQISNHTSNNNQNNNSNPGDDDVSSENNNNKNINSNNLDDDNINSETESFFLGLNSPLDERKRAIKLSHQFGGLQRNKHRIFYNKNIIIKNDRQEMILHQTKREVMERHNDHRHFDDDDDDGDDDDDDSYCLVEDCLTEIVEGYTERELAQSAKIKKG